MSSAKSNIGSRSYPGDGIGKEVIPEGLRVLEAAAKSTAFQCISTISTLPPGTITKSTAR